MSSNVTGKTGGPNTTGDTTNAGGTTNADRAATTGAAPTVAEEPGHGSSTASWTAVVIMLVAFAIGTVAFFFSIVWLVWASAVLLIAGLFVGYALAKAGYGVDGDKTAAKSAARGH